MNAAHADALLLQGRCPRCAERVPRVQVLRGGTCLRCEAALRWQSRGLGLDQSLRTMMGRRRWLAYGLIAAGSFGAGLVPVAHVVLQPLLLVAAMLVAHVWIVRHGLRWLGPGRRVTTRLNLKLAAALLGCLSLLINVAVAPLLSVASVALAATGCLLLVVYLELALSMLSRRLAWEKEGRPLQLWEWAIPAGLLLGLFVVTVGGALGIWGLVYLLMETSLPSVTEITDWLLGEG